MAEKNIIKHSNRRNGGRRRRNQDPKAIRRMFELVRLVNGGMPLSQAFKKVHPYTKAKKKNWSIHGREIYAYYEQHYKGNVAAVAEAADMGADRLVEEIRKKLDVRMLKDVYEERTKTYLLPDGTEVTEPYSVRVTTEAGDTTNQMKAIELLSKILGVGIPKDATPGSLTVNLVQNPQFIALVKALGPMNPEVQKQILVLTGNGQDGKE